VTKASGFDGSVVSIDASASLPLLAAFVLLLSRVPLLSSTFLLWFILLVKIAVLDISLLALILLAIVFPLIRTILGLRTATLLILFAIHGEPPYKLPLNSLPRPNLSPAPVSFSM
jgi:hypothetical protein